MSREGFTISPARKSRNTFTPPTAPQTMRFGTTSQGKASRNLSAAAQRGNVSKQGNWLSPCQRFIRSMSRKWCWRILQRNFADGTMWSACLPSTTTSEKRIIISISFSAKESCLPSQKSRLPAAAYSLMKQANGYAPRKKSRGEDGQIRKGCTVIKKGEVYESRLFTVKDDNFKSEPFLREVKEIYTDLINRHISDPEQQLKVFDKNSVYLPTKKIGKNNPKAAEIEADNAARQEWNRTADMALLSGIEETKILEIKKEEIHQKASQSIKEKGWLPNLFRSIIGRAKELLQSLIREKDMPPKPTLDIDMVEFRRMKKLMIKAQEGAREIRRLQDDVLPKLKAQLADTKGIFKGKERKVLSEQIQQTEKEIAEKLNMLPDILKEDGYPDVQAFMRTFREMESVVEQYNRDLAEWKRQTSRKPTAAAKEQRRPPEKQSVLKHLHEIQERNKQKPPQRQRKKSIDRDSR